MTDRADIPLYALLPALHAIPRVSLCTFPSPVERVDGDGASLWIKRDDLNAEVCGGNKARTLEWLLARVRPGDEVLTLGGKGSTHVLATATHAARIGARTVAYRWRHEMNATADRVATLAEQRCTWAPVSTTSVGAMVRAAWYRSQNNHAHALHYIPLGGSVPLGVLAHVNAAIELALQVRDGVLPRPSALVVPLGSGGTMAGLVLGLAISRLELPVIGVQVTPFVVANRFHVLRLARKTATLIEQVTGEPVPRPSSKLVRIVRTMYGGAYGRQVFAASEAAQWLERANGLSLDHTYSAKAFAAALAHARATREGDGPTLFWNTFDARVIA